MTVHTYENAEIVWPDGERTKVPSMRVEFREDFAEALRDVQPAMYEPVATAWAQPVRCPRHPSFVGQFSFDPPGAEDRLRRMFAMVCWKCYDGRTRSHNRRCRYRGHGRDRCAGEERGG